MMKKELITKPEIKLVGLSVRTNNKNEMDPSTSKIGKVIGQFFEEHIADKMTHRKNPGVMLSVYTEYESDEHGDYTYYFGEEVMTFDLVPDGMKVLLLPEAEYQKLTTPSGKMPEVVIHAWQEIWKMTPEELGGKRVYRADFEVYDERAHDPENTSVDIYIGVKSS